MRRAFLVPALLLAAAGIHAADAASPAGSDERAAAHALEILKRSIVFKTVEGEGQIPAYADYLKSVLVAGGFPADSIVFTPMGETGTLVMRWEGSDKSKKPLIYSGHMDVVAARQEDWGRDPFMPVVENGYLFGRGAIDDKFDTSVVIATLIELKRSGFVPGRTIVMALSGDEETDMKTTRALAKQLAGAEMVLNGDGGGGLLDEKTGKPLVYSLQGAEKTYADFEIAVTNPGGHSSRPSKDNAIYELARIIDRIAAYDFPAQQNKFTRAFFAASARQTPGQLGDAMRRFSENPRDQQAIDLLSANSEYVGQVRTTCVATMLSGGHALNALPQRATVSVNCRIFPGTSIESVTQTLTSVIADPKASVTVLDDPTASDPSPMRKDVMDAVAKAVHLRYPGLPIVPGQASGASDNLHFRAQGIPSYALGGLFLKASDEFTHGRNERVPVDAVGGAVLHWKSLLTDLAG